jgi:glycosyltransferase involved in cell wall biosynthesis
VRRVWFVRPAAVGDPARPSGGNTYDLRVGDALAGLGRAVVPVDVDAQHLGPALAQVPDGETVLLDGLVACSRPGALERETDRLRLVVLVHLPAADETGLAAAGAAEAEQRTLHVAAAVVATSEATGRRLVEQHGLDPARVHVAPPGVDPAPLSEPWPTGTRLACVAAVTPRKGHDVLVDALQRLRGLDWTCVCAGSLDVAPAHAGAVREAVAVAGLAGRIAFPGPLVGPGLDALYGAADLLVLPSRREPYGMVVTEALARGVPVLASAVDGVPQALGAAGAGMLVPPGDAAELAAALRRWLTEPALRERLRAAAADRRRQLPEWADTARALDAALDGPPDRAPGRASLRVGVRR